jgi:serine/threonine-protein kinase
VSEPRSTLLPGVILAGRYVVACEIGRGGMGVVYEAIDATLDRRVAVKCLDVEAGKDQTAVSRFQKEALAVSQIGHPNICDVRDRGTTDDGQHYIVMEYLDGVDLSRLAAREGKLAPRRAAGLVRQILSALDAAHRAGIVHRDLKPENVFVVRGDRGREQVKILDFGIAKQVGDQIVERLTKAGTVVGTPYYMSPEQALGRATIDGRADLWSVGVILYEALTGVLPFRGRSLTEVLASILREEPVPPRRQEPSIPVALEAAVLRALAKDPAGRYRDAASFAAALDRAFDGDATPAWSGPALGAAAVDEYGDFAESTDLDARVVADDGDEAWPTLEEIRSGGAVGAGPQGAGAAAWASASPPAAGGGAEDLAAFFQTAPAPASGAGPAAAPPTAGLAALFATAPAGLGAPSARHGTIEERGAIGAPSRPEPDTAPRPPATTAPPAPATTTAPARAAPPAEHAGAAPSRGADPPGPRRPAGSPRGAATAADRHSKARSWAFVGAGVAAIALAGAVSVWLTVPPVVPSDLGPTVYDGVPDAAAAGRSSSAPVTLAGPRPPPRARPADAGGAARPTSTADPPPAPAEPDEPDESDVPTISVRVHGLPPGARATFDGRPVEGSRFQAPLDHRGELVVSRPGRPAVRIPVQCSVDMADVNVVPWLDGPSPDAGE